MTYQPRFTIFMTVGTRIEQYAATNDYADALDAIAKLARHFPGRPTYIRDGQMVAPLKAAA